MTHFKLASIVGAVALALSSAVPATPQALPGEGKEDNPNAVFFVKNASGRDLQCRVNIDRAGWGQTFALRAGGEFYRRRASGAETLSITCEAPARFAAYRLTPGTRFAYLMRADGTAALVRITAG